MESSEMKRHMIIGAASLAIAYIMLIYYKIACYKGAGLDRDALVRGLVTGICIYLFVEIISIICRKWIALQISDHAYGKIYAFLLLCCLLGSVVITIGCKVYRRGIMKWSALTVVKAAGIGLLLFLGMIILIQITKICIYHGQFGWDFTVQQLAIALVSTFAVCITFLPVVSDYLHNRFPHGYPVSAIITSGTQNGSLVSTGEISGVNTISQTFVCTSDGLYDITFYGAAYKRENTGSLIINLVDETDETIIEQWIMDISKIRDNKYFTLEVTDPYDKLDMKGKQYRFDIMSPDASEGNAVAVYYRDQDYYPDGTLTIGGNEIDGDLDMTVRGIGGARTFEGVRIKLCIYLAVFLEAFIVVFCKRRTEWLSGIFSDH